jgi:hypothetical protein
LCPVLVCSERTKFFKMCDDCACIDHGKLAYQTPLRFSDEQATVCPNLASTKLTDISARGSSLIPAFR